MRKSGADVNFRNTIKAIGGGAFSDAELRALEERALEAATWGDVARLQGIEGGAPVVLSPNQREVIDDLVRRLGDDTLAKRVRAASEEALRTGRVTIH